MSSDRGATLRLVVILVVGLVLVGLNIADLATDSDAAADVINVVGLACGLFMLGYGAYMVAGNRRV